MTIAYLCFGAAAVFALILGISLFRRDKRTCQHRFRPVAVQQAPVPLFSEGQTVVLLKCSRCPEISTTHIAGRWTIEQLQDEGIWMTTEKTGGLQ